MNKERGRCVDGWMDGWVCVTEGACTHAVHAMHSSLGTCARVCACACGCVLECIGRGSAKSAKGAMSGM